MTTKLERKPWKKILYENQDYPDNYTDPTFLKELQKNKDLKIFKFSEAFNGAARLNQQISSIVAFLITFYSLNVNYIGPDTVLIYSSLLTIGGYLFYNENQTRFRPIYDDLKTVMSVLMFGYILSPMLHTLTASISTDTIFTITFVVMIIHLVFFDYGLPAHLVSNAISLNAALFGAICLASRLASAFQAFTLLVVAAEIFALLPLLVRMYWHPIRWLIPMSLLCGYFLLNISVPLLITYLIGLIFINLICPVIFILEQRHKNNIHGPWDEAIVSDTIFIDN